MTTDATVAEPTHHITLEAGGITRGLVLCDSKGLADMRQITKTPIRRMPLKMQQGDSEWSDFELPYQNIAQDDWSGGRGLKDDLDKTRYWHGFMTNTMHRGKAFLGPQPCLTDGYRVHNHDLYGNTTFQGLYGGTEYLARKFTAPGSYSGRRAELFAKKVGTPNGDLTVELHSADAWDQTADLESGDLTDFDASTPALDAEVNAVADFDAETDADNDLNDHADAAHDGAVGLEITFDDANVAYGTVDFDAINQTSWVYTFWFNKNDVAIESGKYINIAYAIDGAVVSSDIVRLRNNAGTYELRYYLRNDSGYEAAITTECADGWHQVTVMQKCSTGAGNDNGYAYFYIDGVLIGAKTGVDNDTMDADSIRVGMNSTDSTTFGGSFYIDTLKIDPVGGPFASKLAAINDSYGLAMPIMDNATLRYVSLTDPAAETALTYEFWIDPNTLTMGTSDAFVIAQGDGAYSSIRLGYNGSNYTLLSYYRLDDAAYYLLDTTVITDEHHHVRVEWGASTGAGLNDGYMNVYIDGILEQTITGLDNDTHTEGSIYFGAAGGLDTGTYGIFYMDDCKWSNASPYDPGSVLAGVTAANNGAMSWISQMLEFTFGAAGSLVSGTDYWIVVYGDASDDADNHWAIGVNDTVGTDAVAQSVDGSAWLDASVSPYFHVTDWKIDFIAHLFEYKGQMYFIKREDDGAAPELYINGTRGESVGVSSSTTLEHSGIGWTNSQWKENIVVLVGGTGMGQWREITDNDDDTLTVSPVWEVTPDTTTEYVILGSNTWTEIGTTGLTVPVTDVLVVKDVVYFCQGEATAIRRFNYAANTNSFADDADNGGTNKATFMELVHESGGAKVYKANNAAVSVTVAAADPAVWGTDLSFDTAIDCGNSTVPITGLERYFDPEYLLVLKEDQVGRVVGDEYQVMPIREFVAAKSENTGRASTVAGVYLYLTAMRGLERYYQNRLDDVGPNLDDGLQPGYQGPIHDLLSFPGRIYAAVSGEDWGGASFGSIQVHNGLGWHSWYRSQLLGSKIRKMHHQVIPGSTPDRMWVSEGGDVIWLTMPSETLDPTEDNNYKFFHCGMLQTSRQFMNLRDIDKTFKSMKMFIDDTVVDHQYITDSYSLEGATTVEAYATFNSIINEHDLAATQVKGIQIQFKHVFWTDDETKTPILRATVIEAVAHLPTKFRYSIQFRAGDENIDLRGDEESYAIGAFISALETWANNGTLLTMRHHNEDGPMDNKSVFISAPNISPISNIDDENLASYLCTMEIYEA